MTEPRCPQCGKPLEARFAPFCSARCQQVDLGRWLKGGYVIPAAPDGTKPEDDEAVPQPDAEPDAGE